MSAEFLVADDYTAVAIDIEANDPNALMALWKMAPVGTRVSQTFVRAFGPAEINAFLVMVKDGVELTAAVVALAKTLRDIKQASPHLSLRLRVRYGSKVIDSDLGALKTKEWEVEFVRQSKAKFVGDEILAEDARRRGVADVAGDQ
ncbi:hypothetical protein ABWH74_001559 [Burkholderia vietnamiensis]|jgi:hypothetical protein|uniref:Uncharacterized protein n=1 Tax=Burkholderia vietnamiensis TaxID=60552 RepID=A0AAW7SZE8_BURVI|nr:hypothetical protein [Burkholderia vietnamiensis]MBR8009396.1 hypothetical protein [Burkholderia vietnamiensis]MBR8190426.1 hypothetical protein [Burkholderia vietnamiensis]MCA8269152.1 hypothetical protein [Burkholderia vietnamiensis]MCA8450298.1 hypothetical protein [Burkholderia vietnamiensis]MDN7412063.1 hypothetical protein [Burkholderia vietnamiensis]